LSSARGLDQSACGLDQSACGLDQNDLAYYRAIPYLLVVETVERAGAWWRRATYPELPGCVAEAESAVEAIERLEQERDAMLAQRWQRGEPIPVPRPPLRSRVLA
jgi:predicted RNase H-like HicB family nuclease